MNYFVIPILKKRVPLEVMRIVKATCAYYGCDKDELLEKYGEREKSHRKFIAIYIIRQNTKLTVRQIADIFDYSDHSSIANNTSSIRSKMFKNPDVKKEYQDILNMLG